MLFRSQKSPVYPCSMNICGWVLLTLQGGKHFLPRKLRFWKDRAGNFQKTFETDLETLLPPSNGPHKLCVTGNLQQHFFQHFQSFPIPSPGAPWRSDAQFWHHEGTATSHQPFALCLSIQESKDCSRVWHQAVCIDSKILTLLVPA